MKGKSQIQNKEVDTKEGEKTNMLLRKDTMLDLDVGHKGRTWKYDDKKCRRKLEGVI